MKIMAKCLSSHHLIVLLLMMVTTECKDCPTLDPVTAVRNSAVTLTCPVLSPQPGTTHVTWEAVHGDSVKHINQCPSSCLPAGNNNINRVCERVRIVQDPATGIGSLTIRHIVFQDDLWYRCTVQADHVQNCSKVKLIVKDEPPVQPLIKDCKIIGSFKAEVNSTFTLTFSAPAPHANATQIIWGINEGDRTVPITRCSSACPSSRTQRPLCERIKTGEDAASGDSSMTISPVEIIDSLWFGFTVNASSCYIFKLTVKDKTSQTTTDTFAYSFTINSTATTQGGSHTTPSTANSLEGSTETTAGVSNHTVMVALASTIFACIFVALVVVLAKMYLCVRKQKSEDMQMCRTCELESQYAAYSEIVDDDYPYSFVGVPEDMCTFKDQ